MKKVYIVHCWDGTKDDGWYPWLEEKLKKDGIDVARFNMPDTTHPRIDDWINELDKQVSNLDTDAFFVGHSIGCQTILRYLEKNYPKKAGGILLVAPWLELSDSAISDEESYDIAYPWLNTPIDFEKVKVSSKSIACIFSSDDYYVSLSQKDEFNRLLDAKIVVVNDKGHISSEDGVNELEEIYDELKTMLES